MNSKYARAEHAPNCQVDANISENDETYGLQTRFYAKIIFYLFRLIYLYSICMINKIGIACIYHKIFLILFIF